jgi:hypothetical protein
MVEVISGDVVEALGVDAVAVVVVAGTMIKSP